jgi:hypothetical protein
MIISHTPDKHTLLSEISFRCKATGLMFKRGFKNLLVELERYPSGSKLKDQPIVASSISELWNPDDTDHNRILTAGKIQNIRLAAKHLNGIEIPAGKVFSFWRHVGSPTARNGYVIGREIREGCIIPTVAGGICQLSNALYDAALHANFTIIERHRHTKIIKGSLAERNRDAAVKWNYLDLRFKSVCDFRIEVELTEQLLIVKFKSNGLRDRGTIVEETKLHASKLNDCFSCGNFDCYKQKGSPSKMPQSTTAFVADNLWPEFENYIISRAGDGDYLVIDGGKTSQVRSRDDQTKLTIKSIRSSSLLKKIQSRLVYRTENIFSKSLHFDKHFARLAAQQLPVEADHVVVSQNLLPYLWEDGHLQGRTFDVLMTRLPMELLHERLAFAHKKFPYSPTLNDFRASNHLVNLESIALTKARNVITPHAEIAQIFKNKAVKLDWCRPKMMKTYSLGTKILFPASAVARKGAYEIRRLASELNLNIVVVGKAIEHDDFWNGMKIEYLREESFENIALVVYPTYVEHQPRLMLKAIEAGIPVITTPASGVAASDLVTLVPMGDYEMFKEVVAKKFACAFSND